MKYILSLFCVITMLISCKNGNETCNSSSIELQTIIKSYENHQGFDSVEFPLGVFTKEYY